MLLMVIWIICGILAYGLLKNCIKEYLKKFNFLSYDVDLRGFEKALWFYSFLGPFGLFIALCALMDTHGICGYSNSWLCYCMPKELYEPREKPPEI